MQVFEGNIAPPGEGKIAIVVAKFNRAITQNLLDGCVAKLKQNGIRDNDLTVAWVPGAFEIPTIAARFADDEDYQAVICLGCVIKGETSHDEHINRAVSQEIARLGVEMGIPVIFGMITCNSKEQALARSKPIASGEAEPSRDKIGEVAVGNKGVEAAEAALEMLDLLMKIPEPADSSDDEELIVSARQNARRFQSGEFDVEESPSSDDDFEEDDEASFGDFSREGRGGPRGGFGGGKGGFGGGKGGFGGGKGGFGGANRNGGRSDSSSGGFGKKSSKPFHPKSPHAPKGKPFGKGKQR